MLKNFTLLLAATAAMGLVAAAPNPTATTPGVSALGSGGGTGGSRDRVKLEARMSSGTDLSQAKAKYESRSRGSFTFQRFDVSAEDFEPGMVLDVTVRGVSVGSITIDDFGMGSLQLRTASRIDDPGDGSPIGDFPNLQAGDSVSVGPLSGNF